MGSISKEKNRTCYFSISCDFIILLENGGILGYKHYGTGDFTGKLLSGTPVTVHVYTDALDEQRTFAGLIKIWNAENHVDYGLISVQLVTSVEQIVLSWNYLSNGFDFFVS